MSDDNLNIVEQHLAKLKDDTSNLIKDAGGSGEGSAGEIRSSALALGGGNGGKFFPGLYTLALLGRVPTPGTLTAANLYEYDDSDDDSDDGLIVEEGMNSGEGSQNYVCFGTQNEGQKRIGDRKVREWMSNISDVGA